MLRLLLQGLVWPLELAADEAHYWDWSRRPALCYHTKGPWIAWAIGLARACLGDSELALRLPAYLAHAGSLLAAGWLGHLLSPTRPWAGLSAALAGWSVAAYQVAGSLITVDMQLVLFWMLGTAFAAQGLQRASKPLAPGGPASVVPWLTAAGLCFGCAFLAKFTALLGAVGVGLCLQRSAVLRHSAVRRRGLLCFWLAFCLGLSPVLIWNALHGWPSVAHLWMHLSGGSRSPSHAWGAALGRYLGSFIGAFNPLSALLLTGAWLDRRWRRSQPLESLQTAQGESLLLWSGLPVFAFYGLVSLLAPTEGNWAVAAYGPLVVWASHWPLRALGPRPWAWRPRLARGLAISALGASLVTWTLVLGFPRFVPVLQAGFDRLGVPIQLPLYRISGQRSFAREVHAKATAAWSQFGLPGSVDQAPLWADYYSRTALLAYYYPGQPRAACAALALGARASAYDDFSDTRLPNPAALDRWVILVGQGVERWQAAFEFERFHDLGSVREYGRDRPFLLGLLRGYRDLEH
jgi:4-amino-4-deoxy-L-arabinose transferase-like glycosyltransferase